MSDFFSDGSPDSVPALALYSLTRAYKDHHQKYARQALKAYRARQHWEREQEQADSLRREVEDLAAWLTRQNNEGVVYRVQEVEELLDEEEGRRLARQRAREEAASPESAKESLPESRPNHEESGKIKTEKGSA